MNKQLPILDESYSDTWIRRDENLGSLSYQEYLKTDHWQQVKEKTKRRPNYQKCEFCNSTQVELHHTTYKWIFTKDELRAIISLCRNHHQEVHDLAKFSNISVRVATTFLRKRYKPVFYRKNRI